MDEPLSNLDAQLRAEMRHEIRALQQKLGITMVYVTHDQSEAMSMADQVILMRDGRVEQAAPPDELYARPATMFAARFIGTPPMNILPLAPTAGGAAIAGTDTLILPGVAQELLLGIRPEDVTLGDGGIAAARAKRGISRRRYCAHLRARQPDAHGARARQGVRLLPAPRSMSAGAPNTCISSMPRADGAATTCARPPTTIGFARVWFESLA